MNSSAKLNPIFEKNQNTIQKIGRGNERSKNKPAKKEERALCLGSWSRGWVTVVVRSSSRTLVEGAGSCRGLWWGEVWRWLRHELDVGGEELNDSSDEGGGRLRRW